MVTTLCHHWFMSKKYVMQLLKDLRTATMRSWRSIILPCLITCLGALCHGFLGPWERPNVKQTKDEIFCKLRPVKKIHFFSFIYTENANAADTYNSHHVSCCKWIQLWETNWLSILHNVCKDGQNVCGLVHSKMVIYTFTIGEPWKKCTCLLYVSFRGFKTFRTKTALKYHLNSYFKTSDQGPFFAVLPCDINWRIKGNSISDRRAVRVSLRRKAGSASE